MCNDAKFNSEALQARSESFVTPPIRSVTQDSVLEMTKDDPEAREAYLDYAVFSLS